jgi:hypothetical protein
MIDLNFWSKVNFDGPTVKPELGPCWLWTGYIDKDGYGIYSKWLPDLGKTKNFKAHRYAWEQLFGEPPKLELDHLCRNEPCCNPWHTEDVTTKTNVLRGESKQAKNAQKTYCPKCGGAYRLIKAGKTMQRECHTCKKEYQKIRMRLKRKGL